ncbi:hypothetical protein J6590_099985 [Homalodisca vitripennis]|nr:hypothetical protein J6590_099985 [Homalodisca vitripennis]
MERACGENHSYNILERRDLHVEKVDFCRDYATKSLYCGHRTVLAEKGLLSQSHEKLLEPGSSRDSQVDSLKQLWTVNEGVQYLIQEHGIQNPSSNIQRHQVHVHCHFFDRNISVPALIRPTWKGNNATVENSSIYLKRGPYITLRALLLDMPLVVLVTNPRRLVDVGHYIICVDVECIGASLRTLWYSRCLNELTGKCPFITDEEHSTSKVRRVALQERPLYFISLSLFRRTVWSTLSKAFVEVNVHYVDLVSSLKGFLNVVLKQHKVGRYLPPSGKKQCWELT